jgi:hypothetical protein
MENTMTTVMEKWKREARYEWIYLLLSLITFVLVVGYFFVFSGYSAIFYWGILIVGLTALGFGWFLRKRINHKDKNDLVFYLLGSIILYAGVGIYWLFDNNELILLISLILFDLGLFYFAWFSDVFVDKWPFRVLSLLIVVLVVWGFMK